MPTVEDRYRLAGLYAAVKNYAAAEEQYREILGRNPGTKRRGECWPTSSAGSGLQSRWRLFDALIQEDPRTTSCAAGGRR
jgi:membrane-associated PAP2 superfamily phosphatase